MKALSLTAKALERKQRGCGRKEKPFGRTAEGCVLLASPHVCFSGAMSRGMVLRMQYAAKVNAMSYSLTKALRGDTAATRKCFLAGAL